MTTRGVPFVATMRAINSVRDVTLTLQVGKNIKKSIANSVAHSKSQQIGGNAAENDVRRVILTLGLSNSLASLV